ncbi:hypothetical protein ACP70R_021441 [Stipagrostis hirtigluma subsp. patula]
MTAIGGAGTRFLIPCGSGVPGAEAESSGGGSAGDFFGFWGVYAETSSSLIRPCS